MMIKYLANFRPQTLNDVLLGSKSLKAATAVAAETEVEAQVRESWGESSKVRLGLSHKTRFFPDDV